MAPAEDSIYGPRVYPIKVCVVVYKRKRTKNRVPTSPTHPELQEFLDWVSRPTTFLALRIVEVTRLGLP